MEDHPPVGVHGYGQLSQFEFKYAVNVDCIKTVLQVRCLEKH